MCNFVAGSGSVWLNVADFAVHGLRSLAFGFHSDFHQHLDRLLNLSDIFIVDLGISETLQTGAVSNQRKRENQKTRKRDTFW